MSPTSQPAPKHSLLPTLVLAFFLVLVGADGTAATDATKRSFTLPRGEAGAMLKRFAAQAHREIMFSSDVVSGVTTQEVSGVFTPRDALDVMLAATGLSFIEDQDSGAFAIRRVPASPPDGQHKPPPDPPKNNTMNSSSSFSTFVARIAFLASALTTALPAQTSSASAGQTSAAEGEPVLMSAFEVASTQGKGYTSSNAATGFKTNETLLKIPQAVSVITRDFMEDVGSVATTDIMAFVGVSNFFRGDQSYVIRGSRIAYALIDEMPENGYADNVFVDSITVIRGPAATLYMNASLGGLILKTSKVPLSVARGSFTFKADQTSFHRTELDLTGPLGSLGGVKFNYRFVAALQGGDSYFKNSVDHRQAFHPTIDAIWKNTKIRAAFEYQFITLTPNANNLVTPDGKLYTGAGRDEAYFAPGTMQETRRRNGKIFVFQKFSDNWDMKLSANRLSVRTVGGIVFPAGGVNWPAQTVTFTARRNNSIVDFDSALADVNGRYHIGSMPTQTTIGASYDREISLGQYWSAPGFSVTVPIANPQMNLIRAPRQDEYAVPANPGARSTTYRGNGYVQQVLDVIPNRLSVIAGFTYSKIKINNVTNFATNPPAVVTYGAETIHRYAATFNLTKDLVVYAMESTTFAPQNNRDVNLNVLPAVEGKGQEVGLKTAFFEGRLSSTFSVFKMALTNQSFFAGVRPDGISYFAPIGSTTQKGFDMDVTYAPTPQTQFMATFFKGEVKDQAGADVPNSTGQTISFFGRHEFQGGPLDKFGIGGGYSRISGRTLARGSLVTGATPEPALIYLKPGNNVTAFVTYRWDKHWTLRVNVENVLDEAYVIGAQGTTFADPSPPRTVSLSAVYRF